MTEKEFSQISKLLEEKIARIDDKIDHKIDLVMAELRHIKEQTTKTNGRVTVLEAEIDVAKNNNILHTLNCPVRVEIDKVKDDLLEYKMIKKYPKIAIILVAIITAAYIYSSVEMRGIKKGMAVLNDLKQTEITK